MSLSHIFSRELKLQEKKKKNHLEYETYESEDAQQKAMHSFEEVQRLEIKKKRKFN